MIPLILPDPHKEEFVINKQIEPRWFILFVSLILSAILAVGCRKEQETVQPTVTTEIIIPFETIEKSDAAGTGEYYQGSEPTLFAIMNEGDVDLLGNTISIDAQERLHSLDFNQKMALVVFQSENNIDWLGVEIQRVTHKNNLITIEAVIIERNPNYQALDMELSPYHIVAIPKVKFAPETAFELVISYVPQQLQEP